MKYKLITAAFLLFFGFTQAQSTEEEAVKQVVVDFFEAFHKQDTAALRAMALPDSHMESIGKDEEGKIMLRKSTYDEFLGRIAGISPDMEFKEELTDYIVKVDGAMANAWTPYKFWINGELSHCGVNSFQMIKQDDTWRIFYIVDTRRREGCE
ncbi:nuclear transport factor 2 family protein [Robertkochia marina]|uniref:Nuclear transport factor 2 family protein n=1 Tax=Robertkochia marina TaxID=1227945 RepID=A0A4S3M0K2_9FLAO|nr:nuclear transport factor 2 family protein [Robertkochia marina]THD67708.1 nuclear transport factor 2 family protein [Robertkochia marina]TRZ43439.1 nuclear transport factor 2 family protein [Robertkochia marina]